MKTILINIMAIITLFSALNINAIAQNSNDSVSHGLNSQPLAYTYLKKSHDQRKISSIMFIGGGAMALTGVALAAASLKGFFDPDVPDKNYGSAPDILGIGGLVIIAAAVPIALSARANKKKAQLYMSKESAMIAPQTGITAKLICVGIKINF